jgi:hypothetical protein
MMEREREREKERKSERERERERKRKREREMKVLHAILSCRIRRWMGALCIVLPTATDDIFAGGKTFSRAALRDGIHQMFLQFFYDYSTIIPRAHFPDFPRKILVSRSKENPSPNLACTKFFYNSSTKLR